MNEASMACGELDVVIIGGGPAGAICALELARQGISVCLIFERRNGKGTVELISGRACRLLEQLVKQPLIGLTEGIEVQETISLWGTNSPVAWNAMYNPWGSGVALNRETLDETLRCLACKAGVKIFSDIRVPRARHKNDYWEITVLRNGVISSLYSRILVLATGHARTDLVGRVHKERPSNIVLTTRTPTTGTWQNGTLYLEATKNGWWYSLPYSPSDQLVGYYTKINLIKQSKLPLRDIFFRELQDTRLVGSLGRYTLDQEPIRGHLAGVQTYDRIQGNSWISVGDAAFTSDPLSGMGIEFAVESAIYSASAIHSGLEPSTMNTYESWVNEYRKQHLELLNSYLNVVNAI